MGRGKRRASFEGTEETEEDLIGPEALARHQPTYLAISIKRPEDRKDDEGHPSSKEEKWQALIFHGAVTQSENSTHFPFQSRSRPLPNEREHHAAEAQALKK
jgi:hypothetical protein